MILILSPFAPWPGSQEAQSHFDYSFPVLVAKGRATGGRQWFAGDFSLWFCFYYFISAAPEAPKK